MSILVSLIDNSSWFVTYIFICIRQILRRSFFSVENQQGAFQDGVVSCPRGKDATWGILYPFRKRREGSNHFFSIVSFSQSVVKVFDSAFFLLNTEGNSLSHSIDQSTCLSLSDTIIIILRDPNSHPPRVLFWHELLLPCCWGGVSVGAVSQSHRRGTIGDEPCGLGYDRYGYPSPPPWLIIKE